MAAPDALDALKEAVKAWRASKHPRFADLAAWATARALPEPRPLVGAGGKKTDVAAWLALDGTSRAASRTRCSSIHAP
jgi:hypothetical protein